MTSRAARRHPEWSEKATERAPVQPKSLGSCVATGMGIALFLAFVAALAVDLGNGAPTGRGGTGHGSPFLLFMSLAYFVGGVLGGVAYYLLQGRADRYSGKLAISFFYGLFGYGSIGLANALAYQYFGLNFLDMSSTEEAWRSLPWITLGCATTAALVWPVLWTVKSGQKFKW